MALTLAADPTRSLRAPARPASARELREVAKQEPSADLTEKELLDTALYGAVATGVGTAYPTIFAHEAGHAAAALALYQDPKPSISVKPFQGGVMRWRPSPLTELGEKLGPVNSRALVAGAGTLVDATSSAIAFAVGYRMRHEHPILGPALMGYAGFTMLNSAIYAAGAVPAAFTGGLPALARTGHDFANLATTVGLHPVASVALLAALLPAEYLLLRQLEKHGI